MFVEYFFGYLRFASIVLWGSKFIFHLPKHISCISNFFMSSLCPVTALTTMFQLYPASPESPAFVIPRAGKYVPLLAYSSPNIGKNYNDFAVLPSAFTFHAFRRSGATFSVNNNVAFEDIHLQGSWKSDAIYPYLQTTNTAHKYFFFPNSTTKFIIYNCLCLGLEPFITT